MTDALKRELSRTRPELRLAFSRPGLITLKSDRAVTPEDPPGSAFAWVWGQSLGKAPEPQAAAHQLEPCGADVVHVFARDPDRPVDLAPWRDAIAARLGPRERAAR